MLDIHQRLFKLKKKQDSEKLKYARSSSNKDEDIWKVIASEIFSENYLICIDEFQVTDIADAVILKYLFSSLFDYGVVIVMTSNRSPDQLYKNGLQRDLFLPFIDLLYNKCDVYSIQDSSIDYRVLKHYESINKV
jgi:predicted ATPase